MKTKKQKIIEIVDYEFNNPQKNSEEVLAHFGALWRTPRRTLQRWLSEAREYDSLRRNEIERVKSEALLANAKKEAENGLKSREWYLSELEKDFSRMGEVEAGKVFRDVDKKTGQPIGYRQADFNDEARAKQVRAAIYEKVSKTCGWEAPVKTENDVRLSQVDMMTDEEIAARLASIQKAMQD